VRRSVGLSTARTLAKDCTRSPIIPTGHAHAPRCDCTRQYCVRCRGIILTGFSRSTCTSFRRSRPSAARFTEQPNARGSSGAFLEAAGSVQHRCCSVLPQWTRARGHLPCLLFAADNLTAV
jgi:hypothetical protein